MISEPQTLKELTALLEAKGLSKDQQNEVFSELDQAISLDLFMRLENKLTPEQKTELTEQKPKDIQGVTQFFEEKIPAGDIQESLKLSTEAVMEKFLEKI